MAAEIAYRSGIPNLRIENVAFDAIVANVMPAGIDIAMSGITITAARQKVVDFSVPYYSSNQGVLTRAADPVSEATIHSVKLGVLGGTVDETFAEQVLKVKPLIFSDLAGLNTALRAGTVAAVLNDTVTCLAQEKVSAGALKVVGQYVYGGDEGIVFRKGSPNVAAVNVILDQLKKEGIITSLQNKYLYNALPRPALSVPIWTN